MKWDYKEVVIVVKFYLKHVNDWRENIDLVMNELKSNGFANRDEPSTRMRISNIAYLHTGVGLSKASKKTKDVYNKLK